MALAIYAVVVTVLFVLGEFLGGVDKFKNSAVYQVVFDVVKFLYNSLPKKNVE